MPNLIEKITKIGQHEDDRLLTEKEAAEELGLTNHKTLASWRLTKRYDLPYIKYGGRFVRYRLGDLKAFKERMTVNPK